MQNLSEAPLMVTLLLANLKEWTDTPSFDITQ